jgi:hypothetical protein
VHRLSISSAATLTVAPTGIAACQARRLGAARVAVLAPLVAPAFRPAHGPAERERLRTSFHLPIRLRLALVVSGSWGVGQVEETVSDIATIGLATPVVVCGRNKALRSRLVSAGHHHVPGLGERHGRPDPGLRRHRAERGRPHRGDNLWIRVSGIAVARRSG